MYDLQNRHCEAAQVAQWLGTLTALPVDPGLTFNTHNVAHTCP